MPATGSARNRSACEREIKTEYQSLEIGPLVRKVEHACAMTASPRTTERAAPEFCKLARHSILIPEPIIAKAKSGELGKEAQVI